MARRAAGELADELARSSAPAKSMECAIASDREEPRGYFILARRHVSSIAERRQECLLDEIFGQVTVACHLGDESRDAPFVEPKAKLEAFAFGTLGKS